MFSYKKPLVVAVSIIIFIISLFTLNQKYTPPLGPGKNDVCLGFWVYNDFCLGKRATMNVDFASYN